MEPLKILKHTLILQSLQITLGTVVALLVSASERLDTLAWEHYAINYALSFVTSSTLLVFFASRVKDKIAKHISAVAFLSLLLGNLIAYSLIQTLMPIELYLLDVVFTVIVVVTSVLLCRYLRARKIRLGA